jgi:hypothetical protein
MLQLLKNLGVGFLVSFLGSVPLGYLNVVGYDVYAQSGINQTFLYLLGVLTVEAIIIYVTLVFADQLMKRKKLLKFIEGFSLIFMFVLAYIFYASGNSAMVQQKTIDKYASPFVLGVVLSCFNFIQIPFWTGWNLYLLNGNYIDIRQSRKLVYVFGTIMGTFAGMLTLILSLHYITSQTGFFSKYLMGVIIPLVFAGVGIFQGFKFYKKYYG